MKFRLFLSLLFTLQLCFTHAQQASATKPSDQITFSGFVIRLQKLSGGGYTYDILSGSKIITHHGKNPFTGSNIGLRNREDAVKSAKWELVHIDPITKKAPFDNQLLPSQVARQLQIEVN